MQVKYQQCLPVFSCKLPLNPCKSLWSMSTALSWVQSTTWTPSCWSVYKQQIHTNNDVEGWHNGLNKRASGRAQMPLYMLVHLVHKEACLVALQIRLVSERKLTKLQKRKYRSTQAKILSYWEQYACHQKSAAQLLKACSHVNGPIIQNQIG